MEEEQGGGKEGAGSRGSWSRDCRVELHDLKLVVEDKVAVEAWETEEALRFSFLVFFNLDTRFEWNSCRRLRRLLVLVAMVLQDGMLGVYWSPRREGAHRWTRGPTPDPGGQGGRGCRGE